MTKRIFLISPCPVFLEGLRCLFQAMPERFAVTGSAPSCPGSENRGVGHADVVFLDISHGAGVNDVLSALRQLRERYAGPTIVMVDSACVDISVALIADSESTVVGHQIEVKALLDQVDHAFHGTDSAPDPTGINDEKRKHLRVPLRTLARIGTLRGEIKDISDKGMYVEFEGAVPQRVGEAINVEIDWPVRDAHDVLFCKGQIVRKILVGGTVGVAVEVTSPYSPAQSA